MTGRTMVGLRCERADLVVVGAGIVGLAHALQAMEHGLSVVVIERDAQALGASVRNFGHGCFTAQAGEALRYASRARQTWLRLAKEAGFWLSEAGTVVVARHDDELAVLQEFEAARPGDIVLLDAAGVHERVAAGSGVVGGAWLPGDIRVDPREAIPAITQWLAGQGVVFEFSTSLLALDEAGVLTSRGRLQAGRVVVAVGHDVEQLFPSIADDAGVVRCVLHMLRVADPGRPRITPAVFSGWSLLRYGGFPAGDALEAVRARLQADEPEAFAAGLHLMFTQRPDGDLTVGDTHAYSASPSPFRSQALDDLLLEQVARLLGIPRPAVCERWLGIYASAPAPFLVAAPGPQTRVVSVTSGIGMTTAFGLGAEVVDELVA